MNRYLLSSLLAIAAAAATTTATAGEADGQTIAFTPTKTRAEVQAELQQYRKAGVDQWAVDYNPYANARGNLTRAQVTADFIANRELVRALTSEGGSAVVAARKAPATTATLGAGSAE